MNSCASGNLRFICQSSAVSGARRFRDNPAILKSMQLRTQARAEYADGVADAGGPCVSGQTGLLVGQSVQQRPWFQAGLRNEYTGDPTKPCYSPNCCRLCRNGEPLRH